MSLRIKRCCVDFCVICGIFFCLYGLSMTVLSDIYVLNWTAQNRYVYLWIPILFLVIFEQRLLSYILTVGNIIGIVIGQILGDYLMDYHHQGVFIWIETVFFSLIIGIFAKVIICWRKKRHSNEQYNSSFPTGPGSSYIGWQKEKAAHLSKFAAFSYLNFSLLTQQRKKHSKQAE